MVLDSIVHTCSVVSNSFDPVDCCPPSSPIQEYWSRLPFPTPGDLPDPRIEPVSLALPALAGRFFTTVLPGNP